MYENLLPRFLRYVKTETRSNPESETIPSTQSQLDFAETLKQELIDLGLENVHYDNNNGYVSGTLASNIAKKVPSIGFISHMDTADFNAENVQPQVIENYDGISEIQLGEKGEYSLNPNDFPSLNKYQGETLITTDGSTLLGADDKAGIAEIMTAMEILIANPDILHGEIKVAFGPDEEIGTGADKFDIKDFDVDFAYTMDGGPLGELEYETFNAAQAEITIKGKNVHPGTAKDMMVNALQLAIDFQNQLPQDEVPEKTSGREGFFHLMNLSGSPEEAKMSYIIRDHDHQKFEDRKQKISAIQKNLNEAFDQKRVFVDMYDQYYNMREIIEKDMSIVELAQNAMLDLAIDPIIEPVRGGTDGSKISYMGLPTPNIFAGAENMHGRFEYVSLQTMEKAAALIVKIAELNAG